MRATPELGLGLDLSAAGRLGPSSTTAHARTRPPRMVGELRFRPAMRHGQMSIESRKTGRGVSLPDSLVTWLPLTSPLYRVACWVLVILPVDVLHPNAEVHDSHNGC